MVFGLRTYPDMPPDEELINFNNPTAYYPGYTSSCASSHFVSGYSPTSSSNYGMITPGGGCITGYGGKKVDYSHKPLTKKEKRRRKKKMEEYERKRRKEFRESTLADLPEYKKEIILKHLHRLYRQYKFERGCKQMLKGLKWLLIFFGLALLLNFGKVLNLVEIAITQ